MLRWGHLNLRDALVTGEPQFLCVLYVQYEDDTMSYVVSDLTWRTADGYILKVPCRDMRRLMSLF